MHRGFDIPFWIEPIIRVNIFHLGIFFCIVFKKLAGYYSRWQGISYLKLKAQSGKSLLFANHLTILFSGDQ